MGRPRGHPREIAGDTDVSSKITRRSVTAGLAIGALTTPGLGIVSGRAQTKTVKMAMIAPLSGPRARQGQLPPPGAELAIGEVNHKSRHEKLGRAQPHL